ncbi:MAG: ATP--guanido phosphotransferase, partial [Clostridia bacterium]|nr:ATP--guanido phosphotransferase [Clostridia bacterium]
EVLRVKYGEGSKSNAAMVQISNQITLGISEKNAIDNLQVIARQIMEKERTARREVQGVSLEDQCFRAWGILQNCRLLSSGEMMNLLSTVKLGIGTGILKTDCLPLQLLIEGQPHMFTKICGVCEPEERDAARAKWIREKLTE